MVHSQRLIGYVTAFQSKFFTVYQIRTDYESSRWLLRRCDEKRAPKADCIFLSNNLLAQAGSPVFT